LAHIRKEISGMSATIHTPSPAGGDTLTVGSDRISFRLTTEQSAGTLVVFDVELPPGGGPPALHRHASAELYRVDRGELTFYVEDDSGSLAREITGPGESAWIPSGREHTIRNEGDQPALALAVLSPGREMERFARAAAALAHPDPGEVIALARANGIEITRPMSEVRR
jgi:mannose-6-phosphate isomerase-like protein (cupin superfamily)